MKSVKCVFEKLWTNFGWEGTWRVKFAVRVHCSNATGRTIFCKSCNFDIICCTYTVYINCSNADFVDIAIMAGFLRPASVKRTDRNDKYELDFSSF